MININMTFVLNFCIYLQYGWCLSSTGPTNGQVEWMCEELDTGGRKVSEECWLPRLDSTEPISDVQKFGWFG